MEVSVSTKTQKLAKQYRLSPEEMAFADLISTGWSEEDAWAVAIRKGVTWSKAARKTEIDKLANSQPVKDRIEAVKAVLRINQVEKIKNATKAERQNVIAEATSKEDMLFSLQTALTNMNVGTKEWLDTKKLIVDVTRMKQDEVKEGDSTVHFYLPVNYPVSCETCLRNPANKRGK